MQYREVQEVAGDTNIPVKVHSNALLFQAILHERSKKCVFSTRSEGASVKVPGKWAFFYSSDGGCPR